MNTTKKIILLSYICVASISAAIITPALPIIKQSFSLSDSALAWMVSIFLFGYVFGQLVYGPLASRMGAIKALRLGLYINIIGIVLCLFGVWQMNYALILFGRLISALGTSAGLTCTFILIKQLMPEHEAKQAMSYAVVSFSVGVALAVSLGGFITEYLSWWDCFWLLLAHGLVILLSTWLFKDEPKKIIKTGISHILFGYINALRSPTLIIFSLLLATNAAVAYCFSAVAPMISSTFLHINPAQYGVWNLLNMGGALASGFIGASLIKRYPMHKIIVMGLLGLVLSLASLLLMGLTNTPSTLWFFMSTAALYVFSGIIFPCAAFYATSAIKDTASASSMMSFINMGAATLSVIILGHLPFSYLLGFIVILAGFLVMVIVLMLAIRRPQQQA